MEALASYLVDLTSNANNLSLTNIQAADIIKLWNQLDPYDKSPATFSPRHCTKATGRFKSPKKRHSVVLFQEQKAPSSKMKLKLSCNLHICT